MPIGFWKGSGFSFMLDLLAAALTDGIGAGEIDAHNMGSCGGASQVMIFIDPTRVASAKVLEEQVLKCIAHLKSSPATENSRGPRITSYNVCYTKLLRKKKERACRA